MFGFSSHKDLHTPTWSGGGAVLLGLVISTLPFSAAADFEREFSFEAQELRIANLIGQVEVRGHSGDNFQIKVMVRGEDASENLIEFEEQSGRDAKFAVLFPTAEHRRYVYPQIGRRGRTSFSAGGHKVDSLERLLRLGRDRVEVRGQVWRDAIEIWADVVVQVPRGRKVAIFLGVGAMEANGVRADLRLDTTSGNVGVEDVEGSVDVDTGSGAVVVTDVRGDVTVDTGSGSVRIAGVREASMLRADTGSGSVDVQRVAAREVTIDTGSGSVDVEGLSAEDLLIDTGSGGVDALEIEADNVSIDSGSGGVELDLARMGAGRFKIDTGSGGIQLRLPREISAEFDAETNSGRITVDIDGVRLTRRQRQDAHFTVGDGDSIVRLSTGSGSIRIRQSTRG